MVNTPDTKTLKTLAEGRGLVPISREILGDTETPVSAYLKLRPGSPYSFLFESVEGGEKIGRYSFLGVEPFLAFRSWKSRIEVEDLKRGGIRRFEGSPIGELRRLLKKYRSAQLDGLPRFTGGAVGYVGYDAVRLIEDIPDRTDDDHGLPDVALLFYDTLLCFDNARQKIHLISNVHTSGDIDGNRREAEARIDSLEGALRGTIPANCVSRESPRRGAREFRSNTERSVFLEKVRRCREYIVAGDIFQVVLSQRFETEVTAGSLDIYRALRTVNPSPYMFHLDLKDAQLVGASPELLVRVENGVVQVRPIAGTRWRGATEAEDAALEADLLADEKERAEHIMLLDLGRNDVGRVSRYDTVRVTEQMVIERYSHVMHIVSNVQGRLKAGVDALDALYACYPAGTVSGAPKIRAMEIIDELEPTRRGPYSGAVGYIDFSGNMDTCIAIRTMVLQGRKAYVQAGGGIVFDSVPEYEHQETVNKAKALFKAVELAEGAL